MPRSPCCCGGGSCCMETPLLLPPTDGRRTRCAGVGAKPEAAARLVNIAGSMGGSLEKIVVSSCGGVSTLRRVARAKAEEVASCTVHVC